MKEEDTLLYVHADTLTCIRKGCIPCAYKLCVFPGPFAKCNQRPQNCPRYIEGEVEEKEEGEATKKAPSGPRIRGIYRDDQNILTVGDG